MPKELETVDVPAIEIMAEGTWKNDSYSRSDLDSMVTAFTDLSGKLDPPVKLGHDDKQKLAQKDGYPAVGWVSRLYRKGGKLIADLRDVPKRIADLISVGAYQKISSEIYFDKEVDGTVYPRVLKAIALLGGDMPAVKDIRSIGDIEGLYAMLFDPIDAHWVDYKQADPGRKQENLSDTTDEMDAVAELKDYATRLEAKIAGKPGAKKLRMFLSELRGNLDRMLSPKEATDMDLNVLIKTLGMPEDSTEEQVTAKLADLAKPPEPVPEPTNPPPEVARLTEDLGKSNERILTLERERAQEKAYADVDAAIDGGKFVPAQKDDLRAYAVRDPEGFAKFVSNTPKLAILSAPLGSEGDVPEGVEPTEAEKAIARQMGVSGATLELGKKPLAQLVEEQRDKIGTAGLAVSRS